MEDDLWDGALKGPGDYLEWTVTAEAPEEDPFFCLPHCTFGMTGMINVELPQGSMHIGIVTITNPTTMTYTLNSDETGTISIEGAAINSSSFALGVEIEENDVDAEITVVVAGRANVNIIDINTGDDTPLTSGTYTLLSTKEYMFYGGVGSSRDSLFEFTITWPETGFEDGVQMAGFNFSNSTISSMGDAMMFIASDTTSTGYVTLEGEGEVFLGFAGGVTSATLTLPTSGEGIVTVPAGTHTIELVGYGMLWFPEDGGGSDFPEDVNGDGVVDVIDLLEIIAAWGATSP